MNEVLKMVGEEQIPIPTEGSIKQRLENLLEVYSFGNAMLYPSGA